MSRGHKRYLKNQIAQEPDRKRLKFSNVSRNPKCGYEDCGQRLVRMELISDKKLKLNVKKSMECNECDLKFWEMDRKRNKIYYYTCLSFNQHDDQESYEICELCAEIMTYDIQNDSGEVQGSDGANSVDSQNHDYSKNNNYNGLSDDNNVSSSSYHVSHDLNADHSGSNNSDNGDDIKLSHESEETIYEPTEEDSENNKDNCKTKYHSIFTSSSHSSTESSDLDGDSDFHLNLAQQFRKDQKLRPRQRMRAYRLQMRKHEKRKQKKQQLKKKQKDDDISNNNKQKSQKSKSSTKHNKNGNIKTKTSNMKHEFPTKVLRKELKREMIGKSKQKRMESTQKMIKLQHNRRNSTNMLKNDNAININDICTPSDSEDADKSERSSQNSVILGPPISNKRILSSKQSKQIDNGLDLFATIHRNRTTYDQNQYSFAFNKNDITHENPEIASKQYLTGNTNNNGNDKNNKTTSIVSKRADKFNVSSVEVEDDDSNINSEDENARCSYQSKRKIKNVSLRQKYPRMLKLQGTNNVNDNQDIVVTNKTIDDARNKKKVAKDFFENDETDWSEQSQEFDSDEAISTLIVDKNEKQRKNETQRRKTKKKHKKIKSKRKTKAFDVNDEETSTNSNNSESSNSDEDKIDKQESSLIRIYNSWGKPCIQGIGNITCEHLGPQVQREVSQFRQLMEKTYLPKVR